MALFGFGKKNEKESCGCSCESKPTGQEESGCSCGDNCQSGKEENGKLSVKILGSGCAKCNQLEAAAREALERLEIDAVIDHVTDFAQIAAYGVMSTPALVVDEKVISYGKVLKTEEVIKLLEK